MGWFAREAQSWTRSNPIKQIAVARSGGRSKSFRQFSARLAGVGRAESALHAAYRENRALRAEVKQLKNTLRLERKAERMNRPMKSDQVNQGTYEYYQAGLKRVMALTMKRQRLSTHTMPQIRAELDGLLGLGKPTEFTGYGRRR